MEVKCDKCGKNRAVYFQRYTGLRLCRRCFNRYFVGKVKKTIMKYRMIRSGESIGLAVSGGKDSMVMLHVVSRIASKIKDCSVTVLVVDEGIRGFRGESIKFVVEACKSLDVPYVIGSFKKFFGVTMDEIVEMRLKISERRLRRRPCTYCGVLRRKVLNRIALDTGVDKIAVASNLDDEIQAFLMNVTRGDYARILRLKPVHEQTEGFVPRIKPFRECLEEEIAIFAFLNGIRHHYGDCPYLIEAYRRDIRNFLNYMDAKRPGIKFSILSSLDRLREMLEKVYVPTLGTCKICGTPSSSEICAACKVLKELGLLDSP